MTETKPKRKRAKTSPTARSLEHLREQGYLCAVVEKRNPRLPHVTHDLFGFIDVLAVKRGETLAVQTTSGANVAARVDKIADNENAPKVREAGWKIVVHGWRKNAAGRWVLREVDLS